MSAVPSNLRLANQAHVLEALLALGVATRAELAKATAMSQPTAGKIVDELLTARVLEELTGDENRPAGVGRPGKQLRLARGEPRFVLIELGVERTRLLAAPLAPSQEERWDVEFETPSSEAGWLAALAAHATRVGTDKCAGVVMSVPGMIDERSNNILLCPNLHFAEGTSLGEGLRELFGARVVLLQEVQALSLGQLAEQPAEQDFLLVDVGEGIGGSVVLGGRLFQGPQPFAGEIGHTPIPGNQRACGCGGSGCLETLIAEPHLLKSLHAALGDSTLTLADLERAVEGDKLPPWLAEALDATAMCVVNSLNVFGLARVVLTGALGRLPEVARKRLASTIEGSALWSRFDRVRVEFAPRRRARGLGMAAFQRIVVPTDWARTSPSAGKVSA
jgi:predicted NBD/HSP70 family sugar kinase